MDFRSVIGIISAHQPGLNLGDAIALADALVDPRNALNIEDVRSVSEYALTVPEVCAFGRAGQKIHAIKELRVKTGCSLAVAKQAIESSPFALRHPAMLPAPLPKTW